ncbi:uncharacterized protein [Coffea arabica]|uniref:Uncharacterized protein isoform X1 n=1 Tax=Coffea arabica TaxID=13443 RepID=A0A6P6UFW8_COFAR
MDNRGSSTTSTKTKDNINTTVQISAPTSKSSSAIPTSSPIPIAPAPAPPSSCNSKYSMEEVWKDICPSALLHQPTSTSSSAAALEGIVFQEFLSRPSRAQYDSTSRHHHHHHHHPGRHSSLESIDRGSFGSHSQGQPAPAATASITLSLNATRPPPSSSFSLPLDHDLDADANLNPPTVEFSILPEKRASQDEDTCHRNKRMIKNRESAARSRARKQAYTSELEIKVARLMEENAKLRRQQQEKHCLQQAPAPFPKKQMLCRTLTAPF